MSPVSDLPTLPPTARLALGADEGWLTSWWTVAVAAALVLALVLLLLALGRRRRSHGSPGPGRRHHRRWPAATTAVAGGALTLALAVNAVVGYFPSLGALRDWSAANLTLDAGQHLAAVDGDRAGTVTGVDVPAPAAMAMPASTTWIYTPPGYDATASDGQRSRYPVLVLAHGSPGTSADWFSAGDVAHVLDVLIDEHVIDPVVAVAFDLTGTGPGADDTECLDSTTGGSQVESYLDQVVVPYVDAHYATTGTHVIAGFSAGAYCALDQGLRHPDLYAGIVAIAPYLDPGEAATTMLATAAQAQQHDIARYAATIAPAHQPVAIALLDESQDEVRAITDVAHELRASGRPVLLHAFPGGHTWTGARGAFPQTLVYVARELGLAR
ncbi:alpha/beta hydrolase [Salana multivorans]|uniref:alpha/beta hydrolase n=1 Tax=Salana multivorans TaxID=120377 RepID=UPI002491A89F|nr:alpha/beta hydrolase-fold protein [Salana multivorans]